MLFLQEITMKRLVLALALAALAGGYAAAAGAQSSPPPLPPMTAEQSANVERQVDLYRTEINGRVGRGEITAAEGDRLLKWREWQIAQQVTGEAAEALPPGPIADSPPIAPPRVATREYAYAPPPTAVYPAPYYVPYYYTPRPYYWGSVCAGGWGHHFGGRICF
jgi:hypothetical protein